ncbi:MAG: hypothetical protein ACK5NN_11810 [Sphingomonadaceae bacterium]
MKTHQIRNLAAMAAISAIFAFSPPATAQDNNDNPYFNAVKACQSVPDDAGRLACYDKAVASLVAATEDGNLQLFDRDRVRETRRKLFGFPLPNLSIFGGGNKEKVDIDEEEIATLETTIAKVRGTSRNGWVIETAEGALWEIPSPPMRLMPPKVGQPVEFRKAALGSYFIRINGQVGVKGKRVG